MSSSHRVRRDRYRAKRLDLVLSQRAGVFYLRTPDGLVVTSGSLEEVENWMMARTPVRLPGPSPDPIPALWVPWIKIFVIEQKAGQRAPRTIETRCKHLATFARQHPDLSPLDVTRSDIIHYFSQHEEWQPQTAHCVRSSFRIFFRLLVDLEHRTTDPARTLPAIRIPRSLPRPCPDYVVRQAYNETSGDRRLNLALRLAVETGMRRVEVARARPGDVEGVPGSYRLHIIGKGGHERVVPISDELAETLLNIKTEWVFPSPFGGAEGPITAKHLGKQMSDALAGGWTAHTLRHRYGTVAYAATGDIRAVQELLGHASPTTTAIYTKITDGAMRRAAEAAKL